MKKYFVTADIHSFMDPFFTALINSGFSWYNPEHFLIICGDAFDRGPDSKRLLDFLYSLQELGRLILIRGNHEDLMEQCLEELKNTNSYVSLHHLTNGTISTISQLTNISIDDLLDHKYKYTTLRRRLCKYFKFIKQAKDYIEIGDYIFVHGWIPENSRLCCHTKNVSHLAVKRLSQCSKESWKHARWRNGMEAWRKHWIIAGKTIVCGHWHTSYGNFNFHNKGSGEFTDDADFGIFEDEYIIALDACTAYSNKVNIKVLEI